MVSVGTRFRRRGGCGVSTAEVDIPPLFEFTAEHAALRAMLRQWLATADRSESALGWESLCADAGIGELLFGGEAGEPAGTAIDVAVLAEESGAALYDGPLLSSAVAGALAIAARDEEWPAIARLRTGSSTIAVANALLDGPDATSAIRETGSACVSGRIEPVWDITGAALILCPVMNDTTNPPALAMLSTASAEVAVTELAGLDLSRPLGRVECAAAQPEFILDGEPARHAVAAIRSRARLVLAAESLGIAQHVLDETVGYAGRRVQFGRTIGSFQAVAHRLADLAASVELARSAVYGAAWALTAEPDALDTEIDLAVAAALAGDTAVTVAKSAVQLHGGIAITWEHWAHRYLRRANTLAALTGGARHYRTHLAALIDRRDGHDEQY